MNQVTTSKKLEKVVDEMSTEMKGLRKELDEVKKSNSNTTTTTGKRCKLPTQVSVSELAGFIEKVVMWLSV